MHKHGGQKDRQAWLLVTCGDDRQYAGNRGYDDDPQKIYHYDSNVPNHRRINEGDLVVIRGKDKLFGIAKIERIDSYQGSKERLSCPVCQRTHIKRRKKIQPPFRCEGDHVFAIPAIETLACMHFKAHFGNSFIAAEGVISLPELRTACLRYNGQLSMQSIDMRLIADALVAAVPETEKLLRELFPVKYLDSRDADDLLKFEDVNSIDSYVLNDHDRSDIVLRSIKARRGQQSFRQNLIARYGRRCMVTGCDLLDIVEAAHISPYRGLSDQHEENGLLLRADIHLLFDLDLMGIEPHSLVIRLHPIVQAAGYQYLEGRNLNCCLSPNRKALEARWLLFKKRLKDQSK